MAASENHSVLLLKEAREKNVRELLKQHIPQPPVKCQEHEGNDVKLCCTTCNTLVCMECTVTQHRGHTTEEVKEFSSKQKVVKSGGSLKEVVAKLEEKITRGKSMKQKIGNRKQAVDETIRNVFDDLEKALRKRKDELLAKTAEISMAKETSLTIQLEELASLKDQIVTCTTQCVAEVEESYSDTELLSVVTTLQARAQELAQRFEETSLKLKADDSILLTVDTETLQNAIETFGSHPPRDYKTLKDPVMTVSSNSPFRVAVHENGDIVVPNFNGHSVNVFDKNGRQKLTFGQQHNGVTFSYPLGVAISRDTVFITECSGGAVQRLSMAGEQLMKFGKGKLVNPWGCAVSASGVIYVADESNSRVQAFKPDDGRFSHTIGGSGQLSSPRDVAIDANNNIHVASYSTQDIKVFSPNGTLIREYGKGVLKGPQGVVVDREGYCLVGDWTGQSLCIFDPQGKLVHTITYTSQVCGVELDREGSVYVAEKGANKVHKY